MSNLANNRRLGRGLAALLGEGDGKGARGLAPHVLGDGLVRLNSALGRHRDPARRLPFPEAHQWVAEGVGHLDLLSSRAVARQLCAWL